MDSMMGAVVLGGSHLRVNPAFLDMIGSFSS